MKIKLLFTGILLVLGIWAKSQVVDPDSRLLVRYSEKELSNLAANASQTLSLLNYSLDNAWFIVDDMQEKYNSLPELFYYDKASGEKSSQPVMHYSKENFNVFSCYFEQGVHNRTYYRIGNTGQVIVFYSLKELAEKYNKERGLSHE